MAHVFWRQFNALFWKNWIILWKHPILNIQRCFVLPVAYGVFLAVAQLFLIRPNNYGIGSSVPVKSLQDQFTGSETFVWADVTTNQTNPSPDEIMSRVTSTFTQTQLSSLKKVHTAENVVEECPQNFNLFSECWAAVIFYDAQEPGSLNYTIRADGGLARINVVDHKSDYEERILPLQWAIDSAVIELTTSQEVPTPLELPFSQKTNQEQTDSVRTSFIRGIRDLLVLAFLICFVGISYQLPGGFADERSSLLTSHMKSMGLSDFPRILSWHLSISLAYIPSWVIVALVWRGRIWTQSSVALILFTHIILGLSLASYSLFLAVPFASRSPQLAAIASTFLSILCAIVAVTLKQMSNVGAFLFTIVFPPGYYVFLTRALAGWEEKLLSPKVVGEGDPDHNLVVLPIIIAGIVDIFLWPYLAVLLERRLYDARYPADKRSWTSRLLPWRKGSTGNVALPDDVPPNSAITIRDLNKTFPSSSLSFGKKGVTAISNLSLNIPRSGILVLLGSNGSGKSTLMSILAGISGPTHGEVIFTSSDGKNTKSRDVNRDGSIGIVPQKNVLFPELSCLQTLRVWRAVKCGYKPVRGGEEREEDLELLLKDCDLGEKIHENSGELSGGQKRKLQLAIGLVGGSKILLVDECTSGVDPLSRRALWRTLTSVRDDRTIIFTTHFLDEADLLADNIAILAAPGRLVANGSPVRLKTELGCGYSVVVSFNSPPYSEAVLEDIKEVAPNATMSSLSDTKYTYHLAEKDNKIVSRVLTKIEASKQKHDVSSYDLVGSSIEGIFLDLMKAYDNPDNAERQQEEERTATNHDPETDAKVSDAVALLPQGSKSSSLHQALVIMHKRFLIFRRSWLSLILAVLIAVCGATVPLIFLENRPQSCVRTFRASFGTPLYLPNYALLEGYVGDPEASVLASPPGILDALPGFSNGAIQIRDVPDNATFLDIIHEEYRNLSLGGVSIDQSSRTALFAWEATEPGLNGLALLNLASNLLLASARNDTDSSSALGLIQASYESFPLVNARTLVALRWVVIYGAAMAVFPAFFALYVSEERKISLVQAMQFSNGLSNPTGLWIGHLAFDSIFTIISTSIIAIVFATVSNQFHGLGLLWLCMTLYGITATLFSYCISLLVSSPLAAFASAAGYHVVIFLLYLTGYLTTLTYATTSESGRIIDIIHWTMSLLSPICPLLRASFVSINLFSLLCNGEEEVTSSDLADLERYGGTLLYLFIYPIFLFAILVWVDSGTTILSRLRFKTKVALRSPSAPQADIEKRESTDLLRVVDITKKFGKNTVVDHVSLGVSRDVTMALLGPNGAGKTTTFNIIRGDLLPEPGGTVLIDSVSVIDHPKQARLSLGICPQFTPIDTQLTVREHLTIYGRLKGLRGAALKTSIDVLLRATGLHLYSERLASKLSGGNQRKVALCVAMIGNPPVILIDEFSTGIDARMRREMWRTLRTVAKGKAVIITTHSMEEASALSNKVAIIAKKVLALGTPDELTSRYPAYEVHFSCPTREQLQETQRLMTSLIPGAKLADDVATRFEVPLITHQDGRDEEMTLAKLFSLLSQHDQDTPGLLGSSSEYTVEKVGLESVFLQVIKGNRVSEDRPKASQWWKCW